MSRQEFEIVSEIERIRPDGSGRSLYRGQMSKKCIRRLDDREPLADDCPRLRTAVGRQNLLNPQCRLLCVSAAREYCHRR